MRKLIFYFGFSFVLTGIVTAQLTKRTTTPQTHDPKISNGINLNLGKGIKLVKAYLFYDGGARVADSNLADLGQNVNMLIQIEKGGWVEKDQKVSIGASEKISTNTGAMILNEADLFAKFADISAEDAQYITLKAVITSQTKKFEFFLVSFTIWDKWGSGKITGSYKLKIR